MPWNLLLETDQRPKGGAILCRGDGGVEGGKGRWRCVGWGGSGLHLPKNDHPHRLQRWDACNVM